MTSAAPGPVPKSWWDLEDPAVLGFPTQERTTNGELATYSDLLVGVLPRAVVRRLKKQRKPLQERAGSVKQGRPQGFPAVLAGKTSWCPSAEDAERTIHLTGPLAWHTSLRGSNPSRIPIGELQPGTLRRPNPVDEIERHGVQDHQDWLVLDLDSPGGEAKVMAHGADLALLGLVAGWPFPRVRWWA